MVPLCPQNLPNCKSPCPYWINSGSPSICWVSSRVACVSGWSNSPVHRALLYILKSDRSEIIAPAPPGTAGLRTVVSSNSLVSGFNEYPRSSPGDRKSTRLNSSHADIYTLSLHDALPICRPSAGFLAVLLVSRVGATRRCTEPYCTSSSPIGPRLSPRLRPVQQD